MTSLRFSIVGAADAARNDPAHPNAYGIEVPIDDTRAIAKALGAQIARRGHGLAVYDANFIEADAVEGFVAEAPKISRAHRAIVVRQPQDGKLVPFKEEATHPALFDRRADQTGFWEGSFYRSLADSDGVILLGGGNATLVVGQLALGARIPVIALAATGGSASVVWKSIAPGIDLPSVDEHARMAQRLSADVVSAWIDALEAQRRRRYAVETGPILWHAVYASALFILALVAALGSHLLPELAQAARKAMLLASMPIAGAAGAAIRMVFERRYGSGPLVPPSIAITFALGMMAGALAGLLYLVAQPGTVDLKTLESELRLVSILVVVSTIGGLTAETIFRKLLGIDVLRTRNLAADQGAAGTSGRAP
jgi:hypothetical protein